jgi:hypothetical protein
MCWDCTAAAPAGGRGRGGRGGTGRLGAGGITTVKDMQQLQLASYAVAASPKVWLPRKLPPVRDQGGQGVLGAACAAAAATGITCGRSAACAAGAAFGG